MLSKPIEIDENGNEIVIFDDDLINAGSVKWNLTLCGYFVGHTMNTNELRYNLRRMWSRNGLKEVVDSNSGIFFIKFHNEEGVKYVVKKSPWMVNGKPFVVQKWDINICLDKTETVKLHVWIKLCNVPLEAWTIEGISALASRLLIEIDASKELLDVVEVEYRNALKEVICKKSIAIEYSWIPSRCCHYKVFGHNYESCSKHYERKKGVNSGAGHNDDSVEY
ncbi:zinc knuckle CX2CX4HX4C containing protein [Tanacetum coccineum]